MEARLTKSEDEDLKKISLFKPLLKAKAAIGLDIGTSSMVRWKEKISKNYERG